MRDATSAAAWVLNLDAESELRALRCGAAYDEARMRVPVQALDAVGRLRSDAHPYGLLHAGDGIVGESTAVQGVRGQAWSPTPSALRQLADAGALVPEGPSLESLIQANARETFASLDPLPGSRICADLEAVDAILQSAAPARAPGAAHAPTWLLRASLTTAGRDRLVAGGKADQVLQFARRALASGPLHVEPFVDIVDEFALHGWLTRAGHLSRGEVLRQEVTSGVWRSSHAATEADPLDKIVEAFERAADGLQRLGYYGPFGIDAFTWLDGAGALQFHGPSDVNARYTMSFALGAPELVGCSFE